MERAGTVRLCGPLKDGGPVSRAWTVQSDPLWLWIGMSCASVCRRCSGPCYTRRSSGGWGTSCVGSVDVAALYCGRGASGHGGEPCGRDYACGSMGDSWIARTCRAGQAKVSWAWSGAGCSRAAVLVNGAARGLQTTARGVGDARRRRERVIPTGCLFGSASAGPSRWPVRASLQGPETSKGVRCCSSIPPALVTHSFLHTIATPLLLLCHETSPTNVPSPPSTLTT